MLQKHTSRGYPLPHPEHLLSEDVMNLREAITRIDADIAAHEAASLHGHAQLAERLRRQRLRVLHQFDF